jgi:hypothetical protein
LVQAVEKTAKAVTGAVYSLAIGLSHRPEVYHSILNEVNLVEYVKEKLLGFHYANYFHARLDHVRGLSCLSEYTIVHVLECVWV